MQGEGRGGLLVGQSSRGGGGWIKEMAIAVKTGKGRGYRGELEKVTNGARLGRDGE